MQAQQATKTAGVADHSSSSAPMPTLSTTSDKRAKTTGSQDAKGTALKGRQERRRSATKDVLSAEMPLSATKVAEPSSKNTLISAIADTTLTTGTRSSKKKSGRSKKLVARRGPHRSSGEEAIELAVSSSDEEGDHGRAFNGSESDDPDTEEEADLQIKKLALEKLSLERKDDRTAASKPASRKDRGREVLQENRPSQHQQPVSHNRDSAPASPTPSSSSPVLTSAPSSKKKRNKKAKQDQKSNQSASSGETNAQSHNSRTDETSRPPFGNGNKASPLSVPAAQSQQSTGVEANASSTANKRHSKQGSFNSAKSTSSSTASLVKDTFGVDSPISDWGDSPMPEPSNAVEKLSLDISNQQQQQQQQQEKSTAHLGRPVSRGRGGRAAVEARVEYRRKLAEDPRFVPHLGEFWGHDDRYRGAGLKNFSDRGGFRGRFMGRGGFGRGGMPQGPARADFRSDSPTPSDKDSQSQELENKKDASSVKPKSDRWSHDGYDQLMKVQEKSYRHQRNDTRPRSINGKPPGAPLSRAASNNPELAQKSVDAPIGSSAELLKADAAPNATPTVDGVTSNKALKQGTAPQSKATEKDGAATVNHAGQDRKSAGASREESAVSSGSATTLTSTERPRSSTQFGEKDVKRASRLLHSALPKPPPKTPLADLVPTSAESTGEDRSKGHDQPKEKDAGISSGVDNQVASTKPEGSGTNAQPKFRQPMPQSQPAALTSGFRPHFIPGNFSSRGRGRGQFHPGHPMNLGHRGGHHHGAFHRHHNHHQSSHPSHHQQQAGPGSSNNEAPNVESSAQDQLETGSVQGSKRYVGSRQDDDEEEKDNGSNKPSIVLEDTKGPEIEATASEEYMPPNSSKSLKTAIHAAPFKPSSSVLSPTAQDSAAEFQGEEEYYGDGYNQDGYYYDAHQQQHQQMGHPMYYYYYPPMNVPNGSSGSLPTSMPIGLPVPVQMGMPIGMPVGVPMPGQPYMTPMYFEGAAVPGSVPLNGNGMTSAAPGPVVGSGGEMMMMMMTPEDYNDNYYYYQPTMFYNHPPAQHPDPHYHNNHHQHQPHHYSTPTTQSIPASQTRV
ncbi:hypothetical protein EDD11_003480 [Mortierella claussenii]|nr:hypothetical protein EDD11_003480 [Mortierella claussenii]